VPLLTHLLAGVVSGLLAIGVVALAVYHFVVRGQPFRGVFRQSTSLALFAFWLALARFLFFLTVAQAPIAAGFALIFAPLYALIWAVAAFAVWWAFAVRHQEARARASGAAKGPFLTTTLSFLILGVALWAVAYEVRVRAKEWYLSTATRSPSELEAAARDAFVRSEPDLLLALLAQPSLPAGAFLEVLEADPPALRRPPSSPLWFVRRSFFIRVRSVLERVAAQPALPGAVAEKLATDPSTKVVAAVARNPATPVAVVSALVGRTEDEILAAVASHPGLGSVDLAKLAGHESISVRGDVAHHPNTPVEVLDALSADSSVHVRLGVARNRQTALSTLEKLATDPDDRVRVEVAVHPSASESLILRILADPDERVREKVIWRRRGMSP
jgi:hypothetical protein